MRHLLFSLAAGIALLTFGCSKKAAPEPVAEAPSKTGADRSGQENPMIAAGLEDLNLKIQQQQYDAAVGSLVAMSQLPKSPAQEAQYRARLRQTETALLQKAQGGDVAAQQSVQMLGRMMTGR
jgi:hypothetical protein